MPSGEGCAGPRLHLPFCRPCSFTALSAQLHQLVLVPQVIKYPLGPSLVSSRPSHRSTPGCGGHVGAGPARPSLSPQDSPLPPHSPRKVLPPWGLRTPLVMGVFFFHKLSGRVTDQLAHSPLPRITQLLF